jgi:hypothetical protein
LFLSIDFNVKRTVTTDISHRGYEVSLHQKLNLRLAAIWARDIKVVKYLQIGNCCLHNFFILMVEAAYLSNNSLSASETTRLHIAEDCNLNLHTGFKADRNVKIRAYLLFNMVKILVSENNVGFSKMKSAPCGKGEYIVNRDNKCSAKVM